MRGLLLSWLVALVSELFSDTRHFTLTILLSTQVYNWVLANLMLGVTL